MPVFQVLDVERPAETPPELIGCNIDLPNAGDTGHVYTLHVVGWVLGSRSRPVAVEVVYQPDPARARRGPDRIIRTTPVRGDRADVAAAFPAVPAGIDCHFESLVSVIGLTPEFELRLNAVLEDETRVPIGSLQVRHEPLRTDFEPRLQPLTVTALGRSGTTWLMRMLTAHPQVVVNRRFPYESATAKYWTHALKVLSEPSNYVESSHPDTYHGNIWWVGHHPWYDDAVLRDPSQGDWFGRQYPERLATFFQQTIDDWYTLIARMQDQPDAVYFAEKHLRPNYIPVLIRELYPRAKEVFLVRDFRDMALSVMAFDDRRGWPGFGRPDGVTDEEYVRRELREAASSLANGWRTRGENAHLMRYEDLVARPHETLTSLLEYLELDAGANRVRELLEAPSAETPEQREHRTSPDLQASIGRWKHERNDRFRDLWDEAFGDVLEEFGYSLGGDRA